MLASVKSFSIAFAVALLIFGVTGYCVYPYINNDLLGGFAYEDETTAPEGDQTAPEGEQTEPTEEDPALDVAGQSFTALFVVSDYQPDVFGDYRCNVPDGAPIESYAANTRRYKADVIVLMRADKELGEYAFCAMPNNSAVTYGGRRLTFGQIYEQYGIEELTATISGAVGISINYYLEMRYDLLKNITDLMGGVLFNVPQDMYAVYEEERIVAPGQPKDPIITGYEPDGTPIVILPGNPYTIDLKKGIQNLSGEQVVQLLRYDDYSGGQASRAYVAAQFMQTFAQNYFNSHSQGKLNSALSLVLGSASGSCNISLSDLSSNAELISAYPQCKTKILELTGTNASSAEYFEFSQKNAYALFEPYKS